MQPSSIETFENRLAHLLRPLTNLFSPFLYKLLVCKSYKTQIERKKERKKVTSGHENPFLNQIMQWLKQRNSFQTLVLAQLLHLRHLKVKSPGRGRQHLAGGHLAARRPWGIPSTCPSGTPQRAAWRGRCLLFLNRQESQLKIKFYYSVPA